MAQRAFEPTTSQRLRAERLSANSRRDIGSRRGRPARYASCGWRVVRGRQAFALRVVRKTVTEEGVNYKDMKRLMWCGCVALTL